MSRGLEIELRAGKITQTLSNSTSTVSLQSTQVLNEVLCVRRQKMYIHMYKCKKVVCSCNGSTLLFFDNKCASIACVQQYMLVCNRRNSKKILECAHVAQSSYC